MKIDPQVLKGLVLVNQIALNMIIPILICLFLGKWLVDYFRWNEIFIILFILLGILVSLRNLFVITKKFSNQKKGPKL
ncbi:MAG: AtpZ/AtpI family protein [Eubacteriales bacterium]